MDDVLILNDEPMILRAWIPVIDRQGRRAHDVLEGRLVEKLKKYCPAAN